MWMGGRGSRGLGTSGGLGPVNPKLANPHFLSASFLAAMQLCAHHWRSIALFHQSITRLRHHLTSEQVAHLVFLPDGRVEFGPERAGNTESQLVNHPLSSVDTGSPSM